MSVRRLAACAVIVGSVLSAANQLPAGAAPQRSEVGLATAAGSYPDAVTLQEDIEHDGYAGPMDLPSDLKRAWSTKLPGRVSYAVIAGGRVFVAGMAGGGHPAAVYAYDGASGARLWGPVTIAATNYFDTLTFDGGRLFVSTDDGLAAALNPATGAQIWSRILTLGGNADTPYPPLAFAGRLALLQPSMYDEASGAYDGGPANLYEGPGEWASDGTLLYGDLGDGVAAVSPATNTVAWQQEDAYTSYGVGLPVLHQGQMWIRSSPTQTILQASTGAKIGTFASDTPPAFAGSTVILMTGTTLRAADASSLTTLWTQKGDGQLDTEPVVAGSVVYVGSASGTMYGFSLTTGAETWHGKAAGPISGSDSPEGPPTQVLQNPTIGDGLIAVPTGTSLTVFAG